MFRRILVAYDGSDGAKQALLAALALGKTLQSDICARDGNYDLIVMGHKGHSRLHEYLVGSTTDRVAHLAPCSVLIVR